MPAGSVSLTVKRPLDEVFAYVADFERAPEWITDLVRVEKLTPGDVGVGTRFTQVVSLGGQELEGTMEVRAYEPPHVYAYEGEGGPTRFTARFTLTPEGESTLIRHDYEVVLGGGLALMAPVVSGWLKKNSETALENLSHHLSR